VKGMFFLLALFFSLTKSEPSNLIPPLAYITVNVGDGTIFTYLAQPSGFGSSLTASSAEGLSLTLADDSETNFGCTPLSSRKSNAAVLVSRGNCSFFQKSVAAQAAGVRLLIVYDSLANKYWGQGGSGWGSPTPSVGKCDLDCVSHSVVISGSPSLGEALTGFPGQCRDACASGLCGLAPPTEPLPSSRTACCIPNDYVIMGGDSSTPSEGTLLPPVTLWVSSGDGESLRALLMKQGGSGVIKVTAALRKIPSWDISGWILWAIGCFAVIASSWGAAGSERKAYLNSLPTSITERISYEPFTEHLPTPPENLNISMTQALLMLCFAGSFLGGLYFLLLLGVQIVYIILFVFCMASTSAFSYVVILPALSYVFPGIQGRFVRVPPWLQPCYDFFGGGSGNSAGVRGEGMRSEPSSSVGELGAAVEFRAGSSSSNHTIPLSYLLAFPISGFCVAIWFIFRHSPGSWLGQNIFGLCLCCLSVAMLRISTMRSAALLLWALFFYDVFMVFLTPFLVGESIMVEVATAGSPSPAPANSLPTPACYCRLNPGDLAVCGPGELMPILFAVPRFFDWRGGMALLGLGDIVVPALALAVALRFDFAVGRGVSSSSSTEGVLQGGESELETSGLLHNLSTDAEVAREIAPSSPARRRSAQTTSPVTTSVSQSEALRTSSWWRGLAGARTFNILFVTLLPPQPKHGLLSYWVIGLLGYSVGLVFAQVAVVLMRMGQPALLYLVPCVLVPIMITAALRGEFDALWGMRIVGGGDSALSLRTEAQIN